MSHLAIITGASAGIGAATAARFLDRGFHVINVSRRPCPIDGVDNLCGDLGRPDGAVALSLELAALLRSRNPSQTCLVHNASLMLKDSCETCDDEDFARVMQINVNAINTLNRHLIPLLKPTSSVLYVGSTLSEKAVANTWSYVVSKHAQLGMMRATCQDLMGRGIHTVMVCPGFTDTEMLRAHVGNDPAIISGISSGNSYHRLVRPEEIAATLGFAHDNPALNGTVIHANLGQREA